MDKKITTLGDYLLKKRTKLGFSQADVGRKMGYTTGQFISNWERNLAMPPVAVLKKLAGIYKLDNEELFKVMLGEVLRKDEARLRRLFFGRRN